MDLDLTDTATIERQRATRARAKAAALKDFPADAAALLEEAEVGERHADLIDALTAARAAFLSATDDGLVRYAQALQDWDKGGRVGPAPVRGDFLLQPGTRVVETYKAAQVAVHEHRAFLRACGEAAGVRRGIAIKNNTTEV